MSLFGLVLLSTQSFGQNNEECFTCHEENLRLKLATSIHGEMGLSCLDCHEDLKKIKEFPHPEKL
ncbi:MAG: hypothetical protein N3B16_02405, partial [Candidatus Aminicenantes bacterium]|nr:hypothetical protein [Candidatus Aminicenantes bacterium]